MKLEELKGKFVVRTQPVTYDNGIKDYSYTDMKDRIEVVDVIDGVPLIKFYDDFYNNKYNARAITGRFNDNNWKDVTNAWNALDILNNLNEAGIMKIIIE